MIRLCGSVIDHTSDTRDLDEGMQGRIRAKILGIQGWSRANLKKNQNLSLR